VNELLTQLWAIAVSDYVRSLSLALLIFAVGVALAQLLHRFLPVRRLHPQHQLVVRRVVKYLVLGITVSLSLRVLGVSLGVLMGTAGILTVAIGFAAQTSASNLISGIFLMAERPFVIGDVVKVGETIGEAVSVDLLSVRLRSFDGLLIRIPNETMLRSNVTNLTHYPVRRYDMKIGVAYQEELGHVRKVLMGVADANTICLVEPEPQVLILGYGESAVDLQFSFWSTRENFPALRNSMHEAVKIAFEAEGIKIPFPHRTLHAGPNTGPMPVTIVPAPDQP
jgi:small-conductance mechanosensitive channel